MKLETYLRTLPDVFQLIKEKTPKICLTAVRRNGLCLEHIPEVDQSIELCMEAVRNNPKALEFVADVYQTEQMCYSVLQRDNSMIQFVKDQTPKLCMVAVSVLDNNDNLKYIRDQTEEICIASVRTNPRSLRSVRHLTPKIIEVIPKEVPIYLFNIEWYEPLPQKIDIATAWAMVHTRGIFLKFIPQEERSQEMCMVAVRNDPWALQYTPSGCQTEEMCVDAVGRDPHVFRYVKDQTTKVCMTLLNYK